MFRRFFLNILLLFASSIYFCTNFIFMVVFRNWKSNRMCDTSLSWIACVTMVEVLQNSILATYCPKRHTFLHSQFLLLGPLWADILYKQLDCTHTTPDTSGTVGSGNQPLTPQHIQQSLQIKTTHSASKIWS